VLAAQRVGPVRLVRSAQPVGLVQLVLARPVLLAPRLGLGCLVLAEQPAGPARLVQLMLLA
jgi:hypothetical protein